MFADRPRRLSRMKRPLTVTTLFPLLCLSLLLIVGCCSAATFTWNGSVSSDWFNSTNWIPVGVPASTDTVNFNSGTISLTSSVTRSGVFNWSGGTLSGSPLAIAGGGLLNINGNVALENALTNAGTVTMTGLANLAVYNNTNTFLGKIYNLASGLWDIQTNATIACGYCQGKEFFNNAGTLRKSQGSATASISIAFTNINAGMVTDLVGTLSFNEGGMLAGTYGTAAGGTIDFASGNFIMGVPPLISGPGICEFTGTTLTLLQNVPTNLVLASGNLILGPAFQGGGITNLTLSGATLSSTNTVTGTFIWNSGTINGPLNITNGGVLNISGSVTLENVLTNAGTVTMTGPAYLTLYNNTNNWLGKIYNLASGLWDIQTNATIACGYCQGNEFFNNAGTLRKSQGSGTANISVVFTNTATVTNLVGILSFYEGGTLTGNYGTAAGATTEFASGNFTMGVPPLISGPGICEFTGTTLTLLQNVPTNLVLASGNLILGPAFQGGGITNLTLSGATLSSTNTVTGTFIWNSGTINGPLTITNGGVLNISGSVTLENVLTNAGTVTMTGPAYLTLYNNTNNWLGKIYNLASGLWDIQTNATIACGYCQGNEFFNNAGTLRKSQGSGTANISVVFTNTATVTNLVGILSFYEGGTLTGNYGTAAGATTEFASGNFTMGVPPLISGPGICEFTGTTLTLLQNVPTNLVLASGNVILGPAFQGGGITNLTLSGATLSSTNTVTGTFIWNSGTINGPLTITNGGVLNISGSVTLENVLTNAGTVTMTGPAYLTLYNNTNNWLGKIYNLASGLWDIQTNATIACGYCQGNEFFNNAGTLRKSQGSATASISIAFTNINAGMVTDLVGTLSFNEGGMLAGTYGTAAGGTIDFASGNFIMGVPPVISGPGICEFTGTTLTLLQNVPTNLVLASGNLILGPAFQGGGITNLTLSGATLSSTNTVTGTFIWNSGTINGPLNITNGGVLNISGSVTLENVLTNAGTVTMT